MPNASDYQKTTTAPAVVQTYVHHNWSFRRAGEASWQPAKIPGNNFSDLLRLDKITDPFYRTAEKDLQWIEKEDWEYRAVFKVDAERLGFSQQKLIFEGLDTYSEVFLNGQLILKTKNMFLAYEADVKNLLKAGDNELRILFRSPLEKVKAQADVTGFTYPAGNDHSEEKLSVFTRKAPYHYGWDWGPRFVTSGVWRPVKLISFNQARIKTVNLITTALHEQQGGKALAEMSIEAAVGGSYTVMLTVGEGEWHTEQSVQLNPGGNEISFEVALDGAARWWPRSWGDPVLYDVEWALQLEGVTLDEENSRFGLCTIQLKQERDEEGRSFYFEVNGQPIYIKGANYIPQDSFLDRPTEHHYRQVFEDMAAANMNMVRVWGGGIYEADLFYELADEYGIMVWQDFMFACTMYPGDDAFAETVKEEAIYNLHRLKGHPSLALWCGNNEIAVGWRYWGWQKEFGYTKAQEEQMVAAYDRIFEGVLPAAVAEHDPTRDYLASSPIYDYSELEKYRFGDVHYWGVWHEEAPFATYKEAIPRFMSEYGFQSFPLLESVSRYSEPEDWSIESPVMQLHQKHPRGNGIIKKYLLRHYREPKNFESFLYLSQLLQADGIRIAIEAHRKAKPFCMGTLYWQLNDCWPVASWSGIDYYGQWKALHYTVRKAFSPLLVVMETKTEAWSATVVSDLPEGKHLRLCITLNNMAGERLMRLEKQLKIGANGKALLELETLQEVASEYNPANLWLRVQLEDGAEMAYDQTVFLRPPRSLNLIKPKIKVQTEARVNRLKVTLESDVLVKGLYLYLKGVQGNFSDNFFDLCPGEAKTVQINLPEPPDGGWPPVCLLSVYDSYTE